MPVERFEITEHLVLDDGREIEVVYVDNFDPESFKITAYNPKEEKDSRNRCAIRLRCARVITNDEYAQLKTLIESQGEVKT
jgi:hypothetical protein